ncbi:hypothetical protein HRbin36_01239 [bacterium HR36]|nr:hypothetical protein HRbin36_01239 [bacterium HR36]
MRSRQMLYWAGAATSLLLVCWQVSDAHDLKVFASRQRLLQPGKTVVYLSWGHSLPVDELISGETIQAYELYCPGGNLTKLPIRELDFQQCEIQCERPGIYQVGVMRKPAVFTYVFDESGRRVLRRGGKQENTSAKVDYAMRSYQFAKAIIVCGEGHEAPGPLEHALELLPLNAAKDWRTGSLLRLQLRFRGRPLAGEMVTATHLGHHPQDAWCFAKETDREGLVDVPCSTPGTWVFRARYRQPAPERERSVFDYEMFTATLSLEIGR